MDNWIIFTAVVTAIGASITLFVFVRQLITSRKRIVSKIYRTLIYSVGDDDRLDIVINVKNLTGRIFRTTGPGFAVSNDDFFFPDAWEGVKVIPDGSDRDFIIDIDELCDNLKRDYPNIPNIKITKYYVGQIDGYDKFKPIPRSIKKSFGKGFSSYQIF